MKDLAPIGVSTYCRLHHLDETICALQKNTLAEQSDLYVFSDAAKPGDEIKVEEIRRYLKSIEGFKTINIYERKTNGRVFNNRSGIKYLLKKHGKMIFLEEDIVTSKGFLTFMNQALNKFRHNEQVQSISGFSPIEVNSDFDCYLSIRSQGWSMGFWQEKYSILERKLPRFIDLDRKTKKALKQMGADMLPLIKSDAAGKIDGLDIKSCYVNAKYDKYQLLPTKTLVKNIGLDGSGLHCGNNDPYFKNQLSNKVDFILNDKIKPENLHQQLLKSFYNKNYWSLNHLSDAIKRRLSKYIN